MNGRKKNTKLDDIQELLTMNYREQNGYSMINHPLQKRPTLLVVSVPFTMYMRVAATLVTLSRSSSLSLGDCRAILAMDFHRGRISCMT